MNPMFVKKRLIKKQQKSGDFMAGKEADKIRPAAILLSVIFTSLLTACVSTTSGSFNPEVSEQEALQDYLRLSAGYLEQGDLANARRHLNNAEAIDPRNSEIYGLRGLVYSRSGDLDLAEENFQKSLRLDSDNSQTRNNYAAVLYSNGHYEDAYEQLEIVVQDTEYRGRPQAFENLGLAALRLGREEDAHYAFGRAVQLNPNQVRSLLELSELSLNRGEIRQAQSYYQSYQTVTRFYNLNTSSRGLWLGIRMARASGDSALAQELASTLQSVYPDSFETELYKQSLNQ